MYSMAAAADLPDGPVNSAVSESQKTAVLDAVEKKYAAVDSLTADFVQTTHSEIFGDEAQRGRLQIKRPTKMRWDFTESGKQFVSDGKTMWVYSREDNQVMRFDDVASQADSAQALLQSLDKLDEKFLVDLHAGAAGAHAFDLAPRTPGQVKTIHLVLGEDLLLQHVTITDVYDSVTELDFSKVDLGAKLEDAAFNFQVPAGAEVITAGAM